MDIEKYQRQTKEEMSPNLAVQLSEQLRDWVGTHRNSLPGIEGKWISQLQIVNSLRNSCLKDPVDVSMHRALFQDFRFIKDANPNDYPKRYSGDGISGGYVKDEGKDGITSSDLDALVTKAHSLKYTEEVTNAAKTLASKFDEIDTDHKGKLNRADLERVALDSTVAPELKNAAAKILEGDNIANIALAEPEFFDMRRNITKAKLHAYEQNYNSSLGPFELLRPYNLDQDVDRKAIRIVLNNFDSFDTDHNGKITFKELSQGLNSSWLGDSDKQILTPPVSDGVRLLALSEPATFDVRKIEITRAYLDRCDFVR